MKWLIKHALSKPKGVEAFQGYPEFRPICLHATLRIVPRCRAARRRLTLLVCNPPFSPKASSGAAHRIGIHNTKLNHPVQVRPKGPLS